MLIDGKTHKVFDFKDINSIISFGDWIKRSLSLYPDDDSYKIPKEHLLDYLKYLREAVYAQKVKDKRKWLEKIDSLIEGVEGERK
jgi:hypothetical protein